MDSTDSDEPNDRQHGDANVDEDVDRDEEKDTGRDEEKDTGRDEEKNTGRGEEENAGRDEEKDTEIDDEEDVGRDQEDTGREIRAGHRTEPLGYVRGPRGRLERLRSLLSELESEGTIERAGRIASARGAVDYRYSIMSGFGDAVPDSGFSDTTPKRRRLQERDADEYLVTTRQEGREFVVVADLTDVEAADLTVGIDDAGTVLVIGVEDRAVERVPLPAASVVIDASFSNQILEIRMQPIDTGADETERGGFE